MILGDKSNLTTLVKEAYQKTGVAHILAISGLHTILIFAIIIWILSLFFQSAKFDLFKKIIAIIFLYFYAIITGGNPPVLRATLVLTFITLLKIFNKEIPQIITLSNSALFLTILSPNILFSASFQMSYFCVLGIFFFYRKLYKFYKIKMFYTSFFQKIKIKFKKAIKDTLIITISTKLMLVPLFIYYFHSFTLFSSPINLIVVTIFTPMILVLGFLVIFFSFLNPFSQLLSSFLSFLIETMNKIVISYSKIPYNSYSGIVWDIYDYFIYFFIVLSLCLEAKYKKTKWIWITIFISYLWLLKIFMNDLITVNQNFNVEYNIKPFIARGYIRGNKCLLRHNIPEYKMNSIMKHKIMPSLINYKVDDISFEVI